MCCAALEGGWREAESWSPPAGPPTEGRKSFSPIRAEEGAATCKSGSSSRSFLPRREEPAWDWPFPAKFCRRMGERFAARASPEQALPSSSGCRGHEPLLFQRRPLLRVEGGDHSDSPFAQRADRGVRARGVPA